MTCPLPEVSSTEALRRGTQQAWQDQTQSLPEPAAGCTGSGQLLQIQVLGTAGHCCQSVQLRRGRHAVTQCLAALCSSPQTGTSDCRFIGKHCSSAVDSWTLAAETMVRSMHAHGCRSCHAANKLPGSRISTLAVSGRTLSTSFCFVIEA